MHDQAKWQAQIDLFAAANRDAFMRLWALAGDDDDLRGFLSRALPALRLKPKRGRPKRDIIESSSAAARAHRLDEICRAISRKTGDDRRQLFDETLTQHSADERTRRRKRLVPLWRERYAAGLACAQAAKRLSADLCRRREYSPRTTGDDDRDQLCDKILACRFDLSERTIRADMSA